MGADQKRKADVTAERIDELCQELEARPVEEVQEELNGALGPLGDISLVRRMYQSGELNHNALEPFDEETDPTVVVSRPADEDVVES